MAKQTSKQQSSAKSSKGASMPAMDKKGMNMGKMEDKKGDKKVKEMKGMPCM